MVINKVEQNFVITSTGLWCFLYEYLKDEDDWYDGKRAREIIEWDDVYRIQQQ